jgi:hypothetical protein
VIGGAAISAAAQIVFVLSARVPQMTSGGDRGVAVDPRRRTRHHLQRGTIQAVVESLDLWR